MPAKLTIDDMHALAKARGGKCLSEAYINTKTKMRWQCIEGHTWDAIPSNVRRKAWCPECAGCAKLGIGEMQMLAMKRGGSCLSHEYKDAHTKLRWRCSEGHEWEAKPMSIKTNGNWCPECSPTRRLSIKEMKEIALLRGGVCLSDVYTDCESKLLWRCKYRHEWKSTPHSVKSGGWCPVCGNTVKNTIEEMRILAQKRGGVCLSDVYTNNSTKLRWRCRYGHEWESTPLNVKNSGAWCPSCLHKNELACRKSFETGTRRMFPKCRPEWLQGLELDGYCESLGLAFEYNGRQHYQVVPAWHPNGEQDLDAQRMRDVKKARLCEENWVMLVVIPYTEKNKEGFIVHQLDLLGVLADPS